MVMRPRRVVPENGLVILVSAVSGIILNWINWLSIKICKLGLNKTLNGLVLLSCCLRNLWPLTCPSLGACSLVTEAHNCRISYSGNAVVVSYISALISVGKSHAERMMKQI
jgi:hypothetical protein